MSFIRVIMGLSMLFALQTIVLISFYIVMTFISKLRKKDYTWKTTSLFLKASSWQSSLFQLILYFLGLYGIVKIFMM